MGALCSSARWLNLSVEGSKGDIKINERANYIKNSPFFMFLTSDTLNEFAMCFSTTVRVNAEKIAKLPKNMTYLVAEGELEVTTTLPDTKGKVDTQEYLCKKKPGDILNTLEAQKEATRKLSSSARKLVTLIDDVKTIACERTLLLCLDQNMLKSFLDKYSELAEPITAIIKSHIEGWLSRLPFFSKIKSSQLKLLAAMCRYEAFEANQIVFEENSIGSKLYIVLDGVASVVSNMTTCHRMNLNSQILRQSLEFDDNNAKQICSNFSNGEVELATLKPGDYFGETAIIINIPRTTTVKTKEKCLFVTVDKMDFDNFLKVCPIKESVKVVAIERILGKLSCLDIPFLYGIPDDKLKSLSGSAKIHELSENDIVFRQGDEGDQFFIIIDGEVRIEKNAIQEHSGTSSNYVESAQSTSIGTLDAGKYFGEMALVNDEVRSATVTSNGKSVLLSIDKNSFHHILNTNEQALIEFEIRLLRGSVDLHHIIRHNQGLLSFQKYLTKNLAEENLGFWLQIKEFEEYYAETVQKLSKDETQNDLWRRAKHVYDTFCDENAMNQINIPDSVRKALRKKIGEENEHERIHPNIFDNAKDEIYRIMERDSFARFKTSDEFIKFFKSIGIVPFD